MNLYFYFFLPIIIVVMKEKNYGILFLFIFPVVLILMGIVPFSMDVVISGMKDILLSPSLLLTDYLGVGGAGATLVNAGLCGAICVLFIHFNDIKLNGPFISAVYTVIGFAFFGKNILNIWPIFAGVWIYSRYKGVKFRNHLLVALFGTTCQ